MHRDAQKPPLQPTWLIELMKARERRGERVLHNIVGLIGATEQARCEAHHGLHVMTKDGLVGPPISLKGSSHKLFIGNAFKRAWRRNCLQRTLFWRFRDTTHGHVSMAHEPFKTAHTIRHD